MADLPESTPESPLNIILPHLERQPPSNVPVVLMTCGISGSGKSTLSHALTHKHPNFIRLSVDAIVFEKHGCYGVDYAKDLYETYQDEAQELLKIELIRLLRERERDIVLDLSFYSCEYRDEYRALIEGEGGRWVLVYFDAEKDVLWRRIQERKRKGVNADSAYDVTEDVLDRYVNGFERPDGEGEIVIPVK